MDNLNLIKSIVIELVRYVLIAIFGVLIAKGVVTEGQLTKAVTIVAGALIVTATMIWRKIKTKYRLDAAIQLPANVSPERVEKLANQLNPLLPGGK